jgi:hypothetical protein
MEDYERNDTLHDLLDTTPHDCVRTRYTITGTVMEE